MARADLQAKACPHVLQEERPPPLQELRPTKKSAHPLSILASISSNHVLQDLEVLSAQKAKATKEGRCCLRQNACLLR